MKSQRVKWVTHDLSSSWLQGRGWRAFLLSASHKACLCGKQNKTLLLDILITNSDPIDFCLIAFGFKKEHTVLALCRPNSQRFFHFEITEQTNSCPAPAAHFFFFFHMLRVLDWSPGAQYCNNSLGFDRCWRKMSEIFMTWQISCYLKLWQEHRYHCRKMKMIQNRSSLFNFLLYLISWASHLYPAHAK